MFALPRRDNQKWQSEPSYKNNPQNKDYSIHHPLYYDDDDDPLYIDDLEGDMIFSLHRLLFRKNILWEYYIEPHQSFNNPFTSSNNINYYPSGDN